MAMESSSTTTPATTTLREVLDQQVPLLDVAPTEGLRRPIVKVILDAIRPGQPSKDVREAYHIVTQYLGYWDAQILESLLENLKRGLLLEEKDPTQQQQEQLQHAAAAGDFRQVLLDVLPSAVAPATTKSRQQQKIGNGDDSASAAATVLNVLHAVLEQDHTALLPILGCLSQLELPDDDGRRRTLQLSVNAFSLVAESELPSLTKSVLQHVQTPTEANSVWEALRKELHLIQQEQQQWKQEQHQQYAQKDDEDDPSILIAQVVLSIFASNEMLYKSYLKILQGLADTADDKSYILFLDLVVLLVSAEESASDRIVDTWLSRGMFPYDTLEQLLSRLSNTVLYRTVAPKLLRLAIFLLLAPARIIPPSQIQSSTSRLPTTVAAAQENSKYVLHLHKMLDREKQAELVHSLLHLSQETQQQTNMIPTHRAVNAILQTLAETAPTALLRFRHVLIQRLTATTRTEMNTSTTTHDDELDSIRQWCAILVRVDRTDDCSDLMMLLQKLLFSSTGSGGGGRLAGGADDSSKTVRGILLGTELLRSCHNNKEMALDKESIKNWVLRLLLPATRRMVDPILGPPGLEFLLVWKSLDTTGHSKPVFQWFKMILANTGLIQMRSNYQRSNDTILGYVESPKELKSATSNKGRDMLFCVNFFLRHTDMGNPDRWVHATSWVFELVDSYLRMGREKAGTKWRPDGWLLAAVEFPVITLPLNKSKSSKNRRVVERIEDNFCHFDLERGGSHTQPPDLSDMICSSLDAGQLRQFLDSLLHFSLSLLIGISLSSAVLKNTFEHFTALQKTTNKAGGCCAESLVLLLKVQMIKIYDLRSKSENLDNVLCHLVRTLRRSIRSRQGSEWTSENASFTSGNQSHQNQYEYRLLVVGKALSQARTLRDRMFSTVHHIGLDVIWTLLSVTSDETFVRRCLNTLLQSRQPRLDDSSRAAFRLIDLKCNLLRHIVFLRERSVPLPGEFYAGRKGLCYIFREACFLLDVLPKLRKHFALLPKEDLAHASLTHVVTMATSCLRLLVLVISGPSLSDSSSFEDCIMCCECELLCRDTHAAITLVEAVTTLFDYFAEQLRGTDISTMSASILEVLSVLAMCSSSRILMERTIDLSWTALYTVYAFPNSFEHVTATMPFSLEESMRMASLDCSSHGQQSLERVLKWAVARAVKGNNKTKALMHLRHGLLRHWGLISGWKLGILCVDHLSTMVLELSNLVQSANSCFTNHTGEEEKKESEAVPRKRKTMELPSLIGLEAATVPEYIEILLLMIIGATAQFRPGSPDQKQPYCVIESFVSLFHQVIDLYQNHFIMFPKRTASTVSMGSKEMLVVVLAQVQRCVEWRNSQPLLSIKERECGKHDPGTLALLQELLDKVSSRTVVPVVQLCDFWSREESHRTLPRCTTLRYNAEKAGRRLKTIASLYNLNTPSTDEGIIRDLSNRTQKQVPKGFHEQEASSNHFGEQCSAQSMLDEEPEEDDPWDEIGNQELYKTVANDSSEDSFGADWCEDFDDEASEGSLDLDTPLFRR